MEEVPFDDRHIPRVEVDWERSAWWWYPLTRAIHPAMRMNALAVGLIAILLSQVGIRLGEWMFAPDWRPSFQSISFSTHVYSWQILHWIGDIIQSILSFQRFRLNELAFVTFELLWLTATLGMLGGILARRSLVELGLRTVAAWGDACRIVFSRWQSYLWSMGMHLVGIAVMLLPVVALGLLGRLGSVGATVAGILLLLCFPLVFGIGRFALSTIVCFPLSVCAIAAEKKADAFEGFSRSNAYFFQRPVAASICVVLLFVIGLVGEQIVFWTVALGWWIIRGTYVFVGGGVHSLTDSYIAAGNWLAAALIGAYWFSFFWSGSAATYLILRKSVDNVELDELDLMENPLAQSLPEIPPSPPAVAATQGTEN